ncbi:BON domain-containing protein [Cupriavidus pauculus]|uniref:BON domain-containing protein n=1 Tax=Cupriavidus pauculus TaxID=82633 RepID=UPI003F734C0F
MYYLADVLPKGRLSLQSGSTVGASIAMLICTMNIVHAQSMPPTLRNFGNDPFVRISQAIADCPEPAGPRISEAQWKREAHHRIEQGNHCYVEGRCRLANAYQYDNDIAEALQRRLDTLSHSQPAWQNSSLWITVSGRRLTVGMRGAGIQPLVISECIARNCRRRAGHRPDHEHARAWRSIHFI